MPKVRRTKRRRARRSADGLWNVRTRQRRARAPTRPVDDAPFSSSSSSSSASSVSSVSFPPFDASSADATLPQESNAATDHPPTSLHRADSSTVSVDGVGADEWKASNAVACDQCSARHAKVVPEPCPVAVGMVSRCAQELRIGGCNQTVVLCDPCAQGYKTVAKCFGEDVTCSVASAFCPSCRAAVLRSCPPQGWCTTCASMQDVTHFLPRDAQGLEKTLEELHASQLNTCENCDSICCTSIWSVAMENAACLSCTKCVRCGSSNVVSLGTKRVETDNAYCAVAKAMICPPCHKEKGCLASCIDQDPT